MGCSSSAPQAASGNGESADKVFNDLGLRGGLPGQPSALRQQGRRVSLTGSADGRPQPELQQKLEKLDEERHQLQEELRRLQSAAALEQDGGDGASDSGASAAGDKPRVRFSRAEGMLEPARPDAIAENSRAGSSASISRRISTASGKSGLGRLSSYRSSSSVGGTSASNIDEHSGQHRDGSGGGGGGGGASIGRGNDIKLLSEMVNRGRRRTRYTHRAPGVEVGTLGGKPSTAPASSSSDAKVVFLPRGGVHVTTKYGAVQFGLPPETIKDSMQMGLTVPGIFVVPKDRFNLK